MDEGREYGPFFFIIIIIMTFLKTHIRGICIPDILLCKPHLKIKDIPEIKSLILTSKFDQNIGSNLSLMQLLGNSSPAFTKSKLGNLNLNLKKGEVVGCKLTLRKKMIYAFLESFYVEIVPNIKNLKLKDESVHLHLENVFLTDDINNHYTYLHGSGSLDIVINMPKANMIFFKSIRFPTKE